MWNSNRTAIATLLCTSLLSACSKEVEKVIPPSSLPPAKIEATARTSSNSVKFEKNSLGKIFVLIPSSYEGGRAEALIYFRPLLVSFERVGNRVALFNKTNKDIYESRNSKQLIQSFEIVSEDETSVTFDVGSGFQNLDLRTSMDIIIPEFYSDSAFRGFKKMELHEEIKESLVEELRLRNNSIFVKQVQRVVVDYKNPYGDEEAKEKNRKKAEMIGMSEPDKVEISRTLYLEIKPYVVSESFKAKGYDKQDRFGYFINRASLQGKTDEDIQITRWDLSDKAGPVKVLLDKNVPAKYQTAVKEGVLYWNLALGKNVLQVETGYEDLEPQRDRTIVVRWITWDEGEAAFANAQGDPLTGESWRGHVYFTTSFTKVKNRDGSIADNRLGKSGLCQVGTMSLDLSKEDNVRMVIAHEVGHVLGLRHNFAGSSAVESTDEQIAASLRKVEMDDRLDLTPVTSTVMDYTDNVSSIVTGHLIKSQAMSYDRDALAWAYHDAEPVALPNSYCSDEHILEVSSSGDRKILGCERRDRHKNPFIAERESLREQAEDSVQKFLENLLVKKRNGENIMDANKYYLWAGSLSIMSLIEKTETKNALLMVDQVVKGFISPFMKWGFGVRDWNSERGEWPADQQLNAYLKEVGGFEAFKNSLIPQKNGQPDYFEKRVKAVLATTDLQAMGFSAAEDAYIRTHLPEKGRFVDRYHADNIERVLDIKKVRESITR